MDATYIYNIYILYNILYNIIRLARPQYNTVALNLCSKCVFTSFCLCTNNINYLSDRHKLYVTMWELVHLTKKICNFFWTICSGIVLLWHYIVYRSDEEDCSAVFGGKIKNENQFNDRRVRNKSARTWGAILIHPNVRYLSRVFLRWEKSRQNWNCFRSSSSTERSLLSVPIKTRKQSKTSGPKIRPRP